MKVQAPVVGGICESLQGRDKNNYYIIAEIHADGRVSVVDGNYKKLASPKKKNVKHVSDSGVKLESIAQKLLNNQKVFDSEVKSALRQLNQQEL